MSSPQDIKYFNWHENNEFRHFLSSKIIYNCFKTRNNSNAKNDNLKGHSNRYQETKISKPQVKPNRKKFEPKFWGRSEVRDEGQEKTDI